VKDEPEIVIETEAMRLPTRRSAVTCGPEWNRERIGGAKERRPADLKVFQNVADHALLQRFHVNDNVRKFQARVYAFRKKMLARALSFLGQLEFQSSSMRDRAY